MHLRKKHIALAVGIFITLLALAFSPFKVLNVTGSSMEPFISENDLIVVSPSKYKTGDIITYKHEVDGKEYLFTHRIIEINGDSIKTKGDALQNTDNYIVKKEDVVGELVLILPFLGAFIHFAASLGGWIGFILIPSAILITMEARKIWRCKSG